MATPLISTPTTEVTPFASSLEHLRAELKRVELLVHLAVARARIAGIPDELRGPTVSEEDVDALLTRAAGEPHWASAPLPPELLPFHEVADSELSRLEARRAAALLGGVDLRLHRLAARFGLERLDVDLLLLGLAPELDARFERLFVYLNDDITRKRPSVDVALGLLCRSFDERLAAHGRLAPAAPLRRHGLLRLFAEPSHPHPTLLASSYKVDERIVNFLLGSDEPDARLAACARPVPPGEGLDGARLPEAVARQLAALAPQCAPRGDPPLIHLHGDPARVARDAAEALCGALGQRLLVVDGTALEALPDAEAEELARLAVREAALLDAAMCWEGATALLSGAKGPRPWFIRALEAHRGLAFVLGLEPWAPSGLSAARPFLRVQVSLPGPSERARLWRDALARLGDEAAGSPDRELLAADVDPGVLAGRFRLTREQIQDATRTALALARLRDPERPRVRLTDATHACRLHSTQHLSSLAQHVEHRAHWEELVLSSSRAEQLRELLTCARHRAQVLGEWGFERKLTGGKALSALFTGPPGTGKTMAAGVLAHELGLELYRIDLASVVSKYVGETEKQLARVFDEAEGGNVVLFFDEADALFGKRSEVRDAHDRYANIETSYLLQRIESYEGVAILATNFARNLDEAFVRRIQFIVDFNLPDERERLRLWQGAWPEGAPLAQDVDLGALAKRFELPGGNIRNIALAAAFQAAAAGGPVTQQHLLRAARREYQKMGKVPNEALFSCNP